MRSLSMSMTLLRYVLRCYFNDTSTHEIYTYLHTLSLHDALPISVLHPPFEEGLFPMSDSPFHKALKCRECGRENEIAPVFSCEFCFRSEENTSELQSLMRISYAVFCLK